MQRQVNQLKSTSALRVEAARRVRNPQNRLIVYCIYL